MNVEMTISERNPPEHRGSNRSWGALRWEMSPIGGMYDICRPMASYDCHDKTVSPRPNAGHEAQGSRKATAPEMQSHHNFMNFIPQTSGAASGILGVAGTFPETAPTTDGQVAPQENADAPRQMAGERRRIRLGGSGALVGFAHLDVPERPVVSGDRYKRKPLTLVEPLGEVSGLPVVTDNGVHPVCRGFAPRLVSQDGHLPS